MEWRPVVGLEDYADVSNDGQIRTHERYFINRWGQKVTVQSVVLKQRVNKCGYMFCNFKKDGKTCTVRVHRAVAMAFVPNPDHKPQVDHIDGDKTNNNVSNLRWCTAKENIEYAIELGLRDEAIEDFKNRRKTIEFAEAVKKGKSKITYCYNENRDLVKIYESVGDAAKEFGCNYNTIGRVCSGKKDCFHGYIFTHSPLYDKNNIITEA